MHDEMLARIAAKYRVLHGLDDGRRERLWQRIEASAREIDSDPLVASTDVVTGPGRGRWHARVVVAGVTVAVAAAMVLTVSWAGRAYLQSRAEMMAAEQGVVPASGSNAVRKPMATVPPSAPLETVEPVPPVPNDPTSAPRLRVQTPRDVTARPMPEQTLAHELSLLRAAENALQRNDPTRAMSLLDEHGRVFPNGQLSEDRKALRVHALCRMGKVAQADAEARVLLGRNPSSPHAERLRNPCREQ